MKKIISRSSLLLFVTILCSSTSGGKVSARGMLSYPTDPNSNIAWSAGYSGVADIQAAFNNGRAQENSQLGKSIPLLTMPSQSEWDAKTDSEKALWLINRERIDRGVMRLDNVETNVTSVAQYFADYLRSHNAFDHNADGRDPWQRLNANAEIGACHDFLNVAENLAAFMTSGTSIPLPVERAVYNWTYDDGGSNAWGHRHANLWYPYNDNGGTSGQEGFIGIGRASGPYKGWNYGVVIVMNVFDPCSTWKYPNSGWTSLGKPSSVGLQGCPAVGANQDGRLEVFARGGDYALWTSYETATNGSWSGWLSFGKPTSATSQFALATSANQFGGMEVFVDWADGAIWHIWQTAVNNGWSSWSTFGTAGMSLGYPAAGRNSDGRQEIFATNVDGNVYHIWQTAPNSGWSSWTNMGKPGVALYQPIAVGWNQYGGMEIYAHGGDGVIYHAWQTGSGWSSWSSLGKPSSATLSYPAASQNADGRQEVFSAGSDGNMWHRWQTVPNGGWNSDWVSMGKPSGVNLYWTAIGKTTDGRMDVFALGGDYALWHKWQIAPNDGWSNDWISLGKPSGVNLQCAPAVGKEANGQLIIFANGNNNDQTWFYRMTPTFPIVIFHDLFLPLIKR